MYWIIAFVAFIYLLYTILDLIGHLFKKPTKKETGNYSGLTLETVTNFAEPPENSSKQLMEEIEKNIRASGYFVEGKIEDLLADLRRDINASSGRINLKRVFEGSVLLTAEEKKELGLNPRVKYAKRFVEYFKPSVFKTEHSTDVLVNICHNAFHKVSRHNDLQKFKNSSAGVRQVKIIPGDCEKIKKLRKRIYDFDEVPELPLDGCDCDFCMCYFEARIS